VGYKPYFHGLEEDWPTFVNEVGVSKSHVNLCADVAYWLTYSDGKNSHSDLVEHQLNRLANFSRAMGRSS
jgi:hypothetical protein